MNKQEILRQLISALEQTLETVREAALQAKEAATDEESQPENEYDTRGLEASYLAGAQAKRSSELQAEIQDLQKLKLREFNGEAQIDLSALVSVDIDGEREQWLFLLPTAGGTKVEYRNQEIQVITPHSPIGQQLKGKKLGEAFELQTSGAAKQYEIVEVL